MKRVQLKVCSGAGCKAWDSLELAQALNSISDDRLKVEVELVPCMNLCGGGVSIRTSGSNGKMFKFRTVDEALEVLGYQALLPVVA